MAGFRDPEFAAVYETGLTDLDRLSAHQMRQFRTFVSDQFNIWEYAYISHEKGLMSDNVWEGYDAFYSSQLRLPSYRLIWKKGKNGWTGGFARHLDAVLAAAD